ncbi:MAG: hypothetical protein BWY15_02326 [Firmicutes bacterium ADurb.Bin193]|nr:MAG: hypothetical protein BWY15_02326 [Firmicutes bacterium ADurb.Bin193]
MTMPVVLFLCLVVIAGMINEKCSDCEAKGGEAQAKDRANAAKYKLDGNAMRRAS